LKREYSYVGPDHQLPEAKGHESALSAQNALSVIRVAWGQGRIHSCSHFKERCRERGIDMLDVENLIRNGAVRGEPEYCPINKNWKYRIAGLVEERHLEVLIALDPASDYTEMPLAVLVTAYERTTKH
jgi:hypothetical protein